MQGSVHAHPRTQFSEQVFAGSACHDLTDSEILAVRVFFVEKAILVCRSGNFAYGRSEIKRYYRDQLAGWIGSLVIAASGRRRIR
jgi:hypothetical protein